MKVGILTERMKVGFGVDLVVHEQATRLVQRGLEVGVFAVHADLQQPPHEYELFVINKIAFKPDFSDEKSMRSLLHKCSMDDVDIWIIHTAPFYEWMSWLDVPVLAYEHGTPPGHFFAEDIGRSVDAYADYRLNTLYANLQDFDKIISISNSIHEWLPPHLKDFSSVLYNGGDHYEEVSRDRVDDFRISLGIGNNGTMALWLGRIQLEGDEQPYKNFGRIRAVAAQVESLVPNCTFVLAGRVSDRDAAILSRQGYKVLANFASEQMPVALSAADLMVNLSEWEGFNLALVESQYLGTPVVAYNIGPHPEVVQTGKTGVLVGAEEDLVLAAAKILTDDSLRAQMAAQAKAFARNFSWEKNVDGLLDLINKTLVKAPERSAIVEARKQRRADIASRQSAVADREAENKYLSVNSEAGRKKDTNAANAMGTQGLFRKGFPRVRKEALARKDDAEFVRNAFWLLLGRQAEEPSVVGYCRRLQNGETRASIAFEIRFSPEGIHRPLNDSSMISLISGEFTAALVKRPGLMNHLADLSIGRFEQGLRSLQQSLSESRNDIILEMATVRREIRDVSLRLEHAEKNDCSEVLGSYQSFGSVISGYALLVATGASVDLNRLQKIFSGVPRPTGEVVCGDHVEAYPDGRKRLIVNGPLDMLSSGASERFLVAMLVRSDLLERLGISPLADLTKEVIDAVLTSCVSISYAPFVLAEFRYLSASSREVEWRQNVLSEHFPATQEKGYCSPGDFAILLIVSEEEDASSLIRSEAFAAVVGRFGRTILMFQGEGNNGCGVSELDFGSKVQVLNARQVDEEVRILDEYLERIQSDYKAFVISKPEYIPALSGLCDSFAERLSNPLVGVVSPLILNSSHHVLDAGLSITADRRFYRVGLGSLLGGEVVYSRLLDARQVKAISHGCFAFRSDVLKLAGGFDRSLRLDSSFIEFSFVVQSLGMAIVVDGSIVAISENSVECEVRLDDVDFLSLFAKFPVWTNGADQFWTERDVHRLPVSTHLVTTIKPKNFR